MDETKKCPMCGEEILSVAKKCKHCGEYLDADGNPMSKKFDRTTYVLLGLFFGGIGAHNFYAEQKKYGIVKIALFIATIVVMLANRPSEPAWLIPASINAFLVLYDITVDQNKEQIQRKTIMGMRPWIFVLACFLALFLSIMLIAAAAHAFK